jgi:isocitrate dehydrogenase (NAD+)
MLLRHIGFVNQAQKFEMALDICGQFEKNVVLTGRSDGATGAQFADYVMETIRSPDLEKKWQSYQRG